MTEGRNIGELAKALAQAQSEMDHAAKDRTNPHFKNKYATLASVIDACRPALNRHGIAIVQLVCGESAEVATVETMLLHASGQSISTRYSMPVTKQDPQGHGSAITYARRYALLAIVGLAADDDDGNDASRRGPAPEPTPQAAPKSAASAERYVITSGPGKGKPFRDASAEELQGYGNVVLAVIEDKGKAAHHARAEAIVDAINAEFAARAKR